jgi:protein O-GlcNAc transferase
VFARSGDYARTEEWAKRGILVGSGDLNARLCGALAFANLRLSRFDEAERVAAVGVQQFPRDPMLHLYYGMALAGIGRPGPAVPEFQQAYALSGDPRVLLSLGAALRDLGSYDEALAAFREAARLETDPGKAQLLRQEIERLEAFQKKK